MRVCGTHTQPHPADTRQVILGNECDILGVNQLVQAYFADLVGAKGTVCLSASASFLRGGYVVLAALAVGAITAHAIARAHRCAESGSLWSAWRPSGRTFGTMG